MFAEDFVIVDAEAALWEGIRPYIQAALRLEQSADPLIWHGWDKVSIDAFLHGLPSPSSLLVAVWATDDEQNRAEQQLEHAKLLLGFVCEVVSGEVCSIRTIESFAGQLPSVEELEPGYQHAFELMRVVRATVAPVAWALFTDIQTWNEWIFAEHRDGTAFDKGALLADLAQQGRCVLMGSQTTHHHL